MNVPPSTEPSVSVVTSAYNDESCVSRAIGSFIGQTLGDWTMIVVNDGSSDGTSRVLEEFDANDERIRVLNQQNTGLTQSLIRGCRAATGKYIARQDADDWSHPGRLEKQAAYLDAHPEVGFVSSWVEYVGPNDEPLGIVERPSDPDEATWKLLHERMGPPAHGSVMFRSDIYEAVGGYRPEFYYGQDSDLWLRMAERTKIGYVQEVLYTCRRSPTSISGSRRATQKRFGELGQACRQARAKGESEEPFLQEAAGLTEAIRSGRLTQDDDDRNKADMLYLIGSQLATSGDSRASGYLWDVIKRRPLHWKAWVRLLQSQLAGRSTNT